VTEDKSKWKNEYGWREWKHTKSSNITAHRSYYWVDRVLLIDEAQERRVLGEVTFTEFQKAIEKWQEVI
jgi:hypothetical protein